MLILQVNGSNIHIYIYIYIHIHYSCYSLRTLSISHPHSQFVQLVLLTLCLLLYSNPVLLKLLQPSYSHLHLFSGFWNYPLSIQTGLLSKSVMICMVSFLFLIYTVYIANDSLSHLKCYSLTNKLIFLVVILACRHHLSALSESELSEGASATH
ncbi:hypothetical protein XENTR_v10008187 [Xenopus tropicalis]|nr:hypothetical protein XENTR_v10008187 [Xenopus tropicalis]